MKDYYQILGVLPTATATEIRKAYYKLAHQYHPDKNADAAHHQKFLEINEAYETLSDKQKRQLYHYRFINFKANPQPVNPAPAASRPASQTRRTTRHTYKAPRYAGKPRRDYIEYEPILRKICKACLLFSLVLILDRFLARELPHETVVQFTGKEIRNDRMAKWHYELFTTNTHFTVSEEVAKNLFVEPGQNLKVWQTPLLKQEIKIRFLDQDFEVNGGSIYHNFFFLVIAQIVFGSLSLFRPLRWSARLNAGIITGVSALFMLIVILLTL